MFQALCLNHPTNFVQINSAMAMLDVRPGDSIPKRLIRPGTP